MFDEGQVHIPSVWFWVVEARDWMLFSRHRRPTRKKEELGFLLQRKEAGRGENARPTQRAVACR